MTPEEQFKNLIGHAKEYGFVFQSSEIYDGLSAVYDYGQNGVILKNRLREYWWRAMVQLNDNIVGLDSAIFMHPTVWKASGHVDASLESRWYLELWRPLASGPATDPAR